MRGKYRKRARFYPQTGNTFKRSGLTVMAASFCLALTTFGILLFSMTDFDNRYVRWAHEYIEFLDIVEPFTQRYNIDSPEMLWGGDFYEYCDFINYIWYFSLDNDDIKMINSNSYDLEYLEIIEQSFVDIDEYRLKFWKLFVEETPDIEYAHKSPIYFGSREDTIEYITSETSFTESVIAFSILSAFGLFAAPMFILMNNKANADNSPYLRIKRRRETRQRLAALYRDNPNDF